MAPTLKSFDVLNYGMFYRVYLLTPAPTSLIHIARSPYRRVTPVPSLPCSPQTSVLGCRRCRGGTVYDGRTLTVIVTELTTRSAILVRVSPRALFRGLDQSNVPRASRHRSRQPVRERCTSARILSLFGVSFFVTDY